MKIQQRNHISCQQKTHLSTATRYAVPSPLLSYSSVPKTRQTLQREPVCTFSSRLALEWNLWKPSPAFASLKLTCYQHRVHMSIKIHLFQQMVRYVEDLSESSRHQLWHKNFESPTSKYDRPDGCKQSRDQRPEGTYPLQSSCTPATFSSRIVTLSESSVVSCSLLSSTCCEHKTFEVRLDQTRSGDIEMTQNKQPHHRKQVKRRTISLNPVTSAAQYEYAWCHYNKNRLSGNTKTCHDPEFHKLTSSLIFWSVKIRFSPCTSANCIANQAKVRTFQVTLRRNLTWNFSHRDYRTRSLPTTIINRSTNTVVNNREKL